VSVHDFRAGDVVRWTGRGRAMTGVIARVRVKQNRKVRKFMASFDVDDLPFGDGDTLVAEVPDPSGKGFWTVPCRALTLVKSGGDAAAARRQVVETKNRIADARDERLSARTEDAESAGLLDLKAGDPVRCQFRDGDWRERTFLRWTGSGKVVVSGPHREERHSPKFVRKVEAGKEAA
jgi:hypothetical protein